MGVDKSCRFKVPKQPTIDTSMLCGQCRDGPRYSLICTGVMAQDVTEPIQCGEKHEYICSTVMGDNMSLKSSHILGFFLGCVIVSIKVVRKK